MSSLGDTLNYLAFNNPISKTTLSGLDKLIQATGIRPKSTSARNVAQPMVSAVQSASATPLWKLLGSNYIFIRIAAVSGASAVCLAAYGRHQFKDTHDTKEIKAVYESANSMHIIHSVVLLAVPLARRPIVTGSLFIVGTVLFSGTCYYKAIKKSRGDEAKSPATYLAPYGGFCLILGWLSFLI